MSCTSFKGRREGRKALITYLQTDLTDRFTLLQEFFCFVDPEVSQILSRCDAIDLSEDPDVMKSGHKGRGSNGFQFDLFGMILLHKGSRMPQSNI